MKLLYWISEWHTLAKLRMHTEDSLELMEEITKDLGNLLRQFRTLTCSQFNTIECPREADARIRRRMKAAGAQCPNVVPTSMPPRSVGQNCDNDTMLENQVPSSKSSAWFWFLSWTVILDTNNSSHGTASWKPKILKLLTVKFHFLGDYVCHIRLFGTTDSYSTQLVGICHCQIPSTRSEPLTCDRENWLIA